MALPPTKIYAYISTPERTFARLKKDGLLRDGVDEADFVRTLRAAEEAPDLPPGMVGPNVTDQVAFALGGFLNEKGRELAMTPGYGPDDGRGAGEGLSVKGVLTALGGLVLLIGVPTGLYLGLLTVLGVLGDPALKTIDYVLGSALALVSGLVISFVGESLIEDVVKLVVLGGGALVIWGGRTTPVSAVFLGVAVGAFMPLLGRFTWNRANKAAGTAP